MHLRRRATLASILMLIAALWLLSEDDTMQLTQETSAPAGAPALPASRSTHAGTGEGRVVLGRRVAALPSTPAPREVVAATLDHGGN